MNKDRIGFLGVGLMGHGAAKNILERGGYPLTVLGNRNREPVDDLVPLHSDYDSLKVGLG